MTQTIPWTQLCPWLFCWFTGAKTCSSAGAETGTIRGDGIKYCQDPAKADTTLFSCLSISECTVSRDPVFLKNAQKEHASSHRFGHLGITRLVGSLLLSPEKQITLSCLCLPLGQNYWENSLHPCWYFIFILFTCIFQVSTICIASVFFFEVCLLSLKFLCYLASYCLRGKD